MENLKFDEDILEAEFHIPNYNYFKEDRTNRDGGGSIICSQVTSS